jgi:hypothetical protein
MTCRRAAHGRGSPRRRGGRQPTRAPASAAGTAAGDGSGRRRRTRAPGTGRPGRPGRPAGQQGDLPSRGRRRRGTGRCLVSRRPRWRPDSSSRRSSERVSSRANASWAMSSASSAPSSTASRTMSRYRAWNRATTAVWPVSSAGTGLLASRVSTLRRPAYRLQVAAVDGCRRPVKQHLARQDAAAGPPASARALSRSP